MQQKRANTMIKIIDKDVLSSDKEHLLRGRLYLPQGKPRGYFHMVHGMTEHIGRFDGFMREMAQEGYITFGYDHLGHGRTAVDKSEMGFIAHKDGRERLIDDVFVYGNSIRKMIGEDLPFILMGHSMGSFIVRLAAVKYNHYDKLIVMGTAGPNPAAGMGVALCGVLKKVKGERGYSKFIYKMAFGTYNDRFKDEDDIYAWLSTTRDNRDRYRADPYCGYHFTVSAMQDLIRLHKGCNERIWFRSVDTGKPILLVAGSEDPVGGYGKGVVKVYDKLKAAGADVQIKLYEGYRHEILNEPCRDEVIADIKRFAGESLHTNSGIHN